MIRVKEAILVEGRYDKNALKQVVDAVIVETAGFGIFKDHEKRDYIRRLADERGIVILTDGDGAGFVIRNHLKSFLPPDRIKQAYIPDVFGKERRKRQPGKEGKIGVEGMRPDVLLQALRRAGATMEELPESENERAEMLTKADLVRMGLAGGPESSARRKELQKKLGFPEHLSANGLLEALNACCTREEVEQALTK